MENIFAIFDLDGTLLDTSKGILESVRYTVDKMAFSEIAEADLLRFIGPPLRDAFMAICNCSDTEAEKATAIFRMHYQAGAVLHAEEYAGIREVCERLSTRGDCMGVATNKPQRFADSLLNEFDLMKYFDYVYGSDENGMLSKADIIRLCMDKLGASKESTVLIGDTLSDARGANEAEIRFLAVTYGFGFHAAADLKYYQCIGIADTPRQILKFL